MSYGMGMDALVGTVFGTFDIGASQRTMNELKPVTVEIARLLLKGGQDAIDQAIQGAKQPWYKPDLTGSKARDEVYWKLKWHADKLKTIGLTVPPFTVYEPGEDLKRWCMRAYIEANAVDEANAMLEASWNAMWEEIKAELAKIPRAVLSTAVKAAGGAAEAVTGVPAWAIGIGVTSVLALIGYGTYRKYFPSRSK